MKIILLILVTLAGITLCGFYLKKNLVRIAVKNKSEASPYKRALNYPLTLIWYGYLIVFFIGLTANNLIFT
ncbi:MAG TPA: hypothetical protein GX724_05410 [Fibrobacter sp.]|nr:hypothetical protein [Fibrobacter sp.]